MFYVRKPEQNSVNIIRPATAAELANYEKRKLIFIENTNTRENKIELFNISGETQHISLLTKDRLD